jgi:hypothetical protein
MPENQLLDNSRVSVIIVEIQYVIVLIVGRVNHSGRKPGNVVHYFPFMHRLCANV